MATASASGRRLLIRPMPKLGSECRNTLQGPQLFADDQGVVCSSSGMDWRTGCCKTGKKHTCDSCSARDSCCETYEHCVSCCLAPSSKAGDALRDVYVQPGRQASGHWGDVYDLCSAVCRSHGRSTSHENSYIGPRHHCFSRLGKPLTSPALPPGALDGVSLTLGDPGVHCNAVCAKAGAGFTCSAPHLGLVNSCDQLRLATNCEAGCVEEAAGGAMPLYMAMQAPKAQRPALCLVANGGADSKGLGCGGSEQHARRLCPCVRAEGGAAQPGGVLTSRA